MMILDFGRYLNIKTIHKTNHKTSQKVKNGKYYKRVNKYHSISQKTNIIHIIIKTVIAWQNNRIKL